LCDQLATAAGGGYELALAADHIMLGRRWVKRRYRCRNYRGLRCCRGTGGLTRITDQRKVRRDHADVLFAPSRKASKASARFDWRLVDEVVPRLQARRCG